MTQIKIRSPTYILSASQPDGRRIPTPAAPSPQGGSGNSANPRKPSGSHFVRFPPLFPFLAGRKNDGTRAAGGIGNTGNTANPSLDRAHPCALMIERIHMRV
jgi:hypothetical protein